MSKYSKEFKEEALKLSDEIGVKKAALQLGLQYYTLADWRKARKYAKSILWFWQKTKLTPKYASLNVKMQSLSGTGHCYDNARIESFFATLKKEKLYQIPTYRMKKEEVKTIVFRYIFIYYNRIRLYIGNPGCLPPSEYRIRNCEKTVA